MGHAQFPVIGAVAGGDVNEARAGLHVDKIGGQERHRKVIALAVQRVSADGPLWFGPRCDQFPFDDTGLGPHRLGELLGHHQAIAHDGPAVVGDDLYLIDPIVEVGAESDGAVAGDGPRRRRPDNHEGALKLGRPGFDDGETDRDRGRGMVVVFDLGLGQGRLFDHRPEDRLGAPVERPVHQELSQLADDLGFGGEVHGGVGVGPIADHAEALELLALHGDPFVGELSALLAELDDRHRVLVLAGLAVGFLYLPFDGQAMAVPAGDVIGIAAAHLFGPRNHVLEDLVQGMADVQVTVGIGRAVVEDKLVAALGLLAVAAVDVELLPVLQGLGLALGQPRLHGKVGAGQEDGRLVIDAHLLALWRFSAGALMVSAGSSRPPRMSRAASMSRPICAFKSSSPSNFFSGRR